MKNKSFKKLITSVFLLTLFIIVSGCGQKEEPQQNKIVQAEPVSVTQVERENISQKKTYSGTLEGIDQAVIVSKIAERVISVNAEVNDHVRKGEVIVKLDRSGATSNYLQAKASFENAKKDYERMKALYSEGAIAQQKLDQVETAYEVAKANYDAATSNIDLESPISGTLTDLNVNVGDWVTPGKQLATIANVNQLIIKFFVSENEVRKINIGDTVNVYSEFDKESAVKGRVTEISRSASSEARSFQIKAKFNNTKNSYYKPGMFVRVDVTLDSQKGVLVVPTKAIVFTNNQNIVYTVNNNNIAVPVDVKVGLSTENITEVVNGLHEGQKIVTEGMNNLRDSSKVSIVK